MAGPIHLNQAVGFTIEALGCGVTVLVMMRFGCRVTIAYSMLQGELAITSWAPHHPSDGQFTLTDCLSTPCCKVSLPSLAGLSTILLMVNSHSPGLSAHSMHEPSQCTQLRREATSETCIVQGVNAEQRLLRG